MKKEKTAIRRSWPDTLLVREVRLIKVIKVLTTKEIAIRSRSRWSSGSSRSPGQRSKSVHGVVKDNADTIVEEGLAKD